MYQLFWPLDVREVFTFGKRCTQFHLGVCVEVCWLRLGGCSLSSRVLRGSCAYPRPYLNGRRSRCGRGLQRSRLVRAGKENSWECPAGRCTHAKCGSLPMINGYCFWFGRTASRLSRSCCCTSLRAPSAGAPAFGAGRSGERWKATGGREGCDRAPRPLSK